MTATCSATSTKKSSRTFRAPAIPVNITLPRAVTQFMAEHGGDPRLGEKILDPACGTGGFLTCALENIRRQDVKTIEDERLLQARSTGMEKKQLPHSLCMTNMLLHDIDVPANIKHDNTLARPLIGYWPQGAGGRGADQPAVRRHGGGRGREQTFPAGLRTRETADLFLVFIMHILKDGGRCGMVLPDGTLFGEASRPASRKSC